MLSLCNQGCHRRSHYLLSTSRQVIGDHVCDLQWTPGPELPASPLLSMSLIRFPSIRPVYYRTVIRTIQAQVPGYQSGVPQTTEEIGVLLYDHSSPCGLTSTLKTTLPLDSLHVARMLIYRGRRQIND